MFYRKGTVTVHGRTGAYIFPAQCGVTVFTVDVSHGVKPCQQQPLLCRTTAHVDPETKCSAIKQQLFTESQRTSLNDSHYRIKPNGASIAGQLAVHPFMGHVLERHLSRKPFKPWSEQMKV